MATAAVCTPTKSRRGLNSYRATRLPVTPTRPTTPCQQIDSSPQDSIYSGKAKSRLQKCIAKPMRDSPKSNIARQAKSPRFLELGISDWSLTGTSNVTAKATPPRTKKESLARGRTGKSHTRIAFNNAADRFIPNRHTSEAIITQGVGRMHLDPTRPKSSSGRTEGSSFLARSAYNIGMVAEDPGLLTLSGLSLNDNNDKDFKALSPASLAYQTTLAEACGIKLDKRILSYKPAPPESTKPIDLRNEYNRPLKPSAVSGGRRRKIATAPERVLDAPELADDYYLNLLDWSSGNQVAVGLNRNVYIWSADSGNVVPLFECKEETYISSVKWSGDGAYVGVGLGTGEIQIWDVEEGTKLRSMMGHESRVGVMGWNKHLLTTGSRSGKIFNNDVRMPKHRVAELISHTSEVCGLEWRGDGMQLATGGNDNLVNIWDARSLQAPKFTKTNHKAAVKALSWCPWQSNMLATGGGTADRHIHFWNSTTGARTNSIDTGSQVTSLRWSTGYKELVSTSGFPDNSISLWNWPTLAKHIEIPAHDTRVLQSCLSPDGQMLVTAAADESLKFWRVFEKKPTPISRVNEDSKLFRDGIIR